MIYGKRNMALFGRFVYKVSVSFVFYELRVYNYQAYFSVSGLYEII